jgi:putative peptidoglycan lipid II flippase
MVEKFFRFLGRDVGSIHHAAYLLALSAFLSQLLGLVRDRLLASTFGAGPVLDIYYAAFRVQDFIFYCVAAILSLAVLIPLIDGALEEGGKERAKGLLNSLFTVSFVLIALAAFLAFVFAPQLAKILFPGLAFGAYGDTLITLMRILLLSPFFFSFSGLLATVVQLYNRFYITSLSPILYNVGIIVGILFFYPAFGVTGLAFGVLLGAFMHMGIQLPFVIKEGLLPRLTFHVLWDDITQAGKLSLFRGVALGMNQLVLLLLTGIATTIGAGSVAVMNFAQNMQNIPLTLVGASYSVATFPVLARFFGAGDMEAFISQVRSAVRHIMFWVFPITVLFIVLRAQIVRVILGSGNFTWQDTRLTAACLALFVVSVLAQSLSLLLVRAYYATRRNKEALWVGLVSGLSTMLVAFVGLRSFATNGMFKIFMEHLLRVEGVNGTAVLILPLAFSVGALINTMLFFILFKRDFKVAKLEIGATAFHSFASAIFMGLVAYYALDYLGSVLNLNTFKGVFLQGFLAGVLWFAHR